MSEAGDPSYRRLLDLLLADERRARAALAEHVGGIERDLAALPERLPGLIDAADRRDGALREALHRPLAQLLARVARDDPGVLVQALFPVIGPLIRRSIRETLRQLIGDLNRSLEASLSLRGLRWRLEAWRSGEPYARVVLRHSLRYRVEHLFWIDGDSGMLLARAHAAGADGDLPDSDAVAGMLTAIGDFVRDAVLARAGEGLSAIDAGELSIRLLRGPRSYLALAIRGELPEEVLASAEALGGRLQLLQGVETDAEVLGAAGERELSAWLGRHGAAEAEAEAGVPWHALVLGTVLAGLLLVWTGSAWYRAHRAEQIAGLLAAEPGWQVERVEVGAGGYHVVGGRDAYAREASEIPGWPKELSVSFALRPLLSLEPAPLSARLEALLSPPPGMRVEVAEGQVLLAGVVGAEQYAALGPRLEALQALLPVDRSGLRVDDGRQARVAALRAQVASRPPFDLRFQRQERLAEGEIERLQALAGELTSLQFDAEALSLSLGLQLTAGSDGVGGEAVNAPLRQRRLDRAMRLLAELGFGHWPMRIDAGTAAEEPGRDLPARRVRIRVEIRDDAR